MTPQTTLPKNENIGERIAHLYGLKTTMAVNHAGDPKYAWALDQLGIAIDEIVNEILGQ